MPTASGQYRKYKLTRSLPAYSAADRHLLHAPFILSPTIAMTIRYPANRKSAIGNRKWFTLAAVCASGWRRSPAPRPSGGWSCTYHTSSLLKHVLSS